MRLSKKGVFKTAIAIVLAIPILFILWLYLAQPGSARLRAAIAATDQLDPHWRLEDLEAHRQVVEDERNSAIVAAKAFELLPKGWGASTAGPNSTAAPGEAPQPRDPATGPLDFDELSTQLNELDFGYQFDDRQREAIARLKVKGQAALVEARKLADLPQGRYSRKYERVIFLTQINDVQDLRTVNRLLAIDALDRADKGDIDGALDSCRAMINSGRSIGDDPFLIAQLVRVACVVSALEKIERVLGLGEPKSDETLARLEALLADEAEQPIAFYGIRGERASQHDLMSKLASGEITIDEFMTAISGGGGAGGISMLPSGYVFRNSHATILEWLNEASRIAQRPRHEQEAEWARLSSGIAARKSNYFEVLPNLFAFLLMPAVEQAAKAGNRHYAQIGCARLMIALERHRLKAKSWPDAAKLESALAPSLLPSWPRDAFVDAPLKLEKTADGWRIWSVGPEKKPDGMSPQKNQRIIYRLLDPEKRRRPQPAKAADKPQEAQ